MNYLEYSKTIRKIIKISREIRVNKRIKLTKRKDQSILIEFIKPSWDSPKHRREKMKIAEQLKGEGKEVFIEKTLHLNGIKVRPDICYQENGKWNIIEIEFGGNRQNKIFKNYDKISKIATVKVVDVNN